MMLNPDELKRENDLLRRTLAMCSAFARTLDRMNDLLDAAQNNATASATELRMIKRMLTDMPKPARRAEPSTEPRAEPEVKT